MQAVSASTTEINALERGLWSLRGKLTFAPGKYVFALRP
jgi:hypothetical protein